METLKDWKVEKHISPFFHFPIFQQYKGFSFLEMLIVIMIVSILFVAFRSSFQVKNKDILYSQSCIESIYGEVNNFLYAWLSSKSLFTGNTTIFPDQYIISFQPLSGIIELLYENQGSTNLYNRIQINGNSNITNCINSAYTIQLTWETYQLHINKWLQETNMKSFFISDWVNTGENIFLQCDNKWTRCKPVGYFESDTRTISIKKQICLSFSGSECSEWDN